MAESKPLKKTLRWRFRNGEDNNTVKSSSSSTVLNALLTDNDFKKTYKANDEMDVIIKREEAPCPAISVDFPCCLLEDDELLEILFIKRDGKSHVPSTKECDLNPKEMRVFLVNTRGRIGIQRDVMENKNLIIKEVDCVCVVAAEEDTVEEALRKDGRFAERLFNMDVALKDDEKNTTRIKNSVTELKDKKLYSMIRKTKAKKMDVQPQSKLKADPADSFERSKITNAQSSGKALSASDKKESDRTKCENIPNTTEILKILRAQFDSLVEQLKAREDVKTPAKVQQLLRKEFSKETQCFSKIKTVKMLMDLSDSVCQVRHNDQAIGTGFLLFETFILTNAHVITDAGGQPLEKLSVSFDFEDLSTANKYAIKKDSLAYEHKYSPQHTMDYAVMELETPAVGLPPPLLEHYSTPPVSGGVCIIGHPEGGVKKMDMCLIIDRLNQEGTVIKHISDHPEYFQVITEKYFGMTQELDGNQIEYSSCFYYGSSGSPVFDECGNVIGMHSGGYVYKKGKETIGSVIEFAHPLQPILASIYRKIKDNPSSVCTSLCAALEVMLADDKTFYPDDDDMDCH